MHQTNLVDYGVVQAFVCLSLYYISIARFLPKAISLAMNGGVLSNHDKLYLKSKIAAVSLTLSFLIISIYRLFATNNLLFLACCLFSTLFTRYVFVFLRYKSVFRGFGAPGFMAYWFELYIFATFLLSFFTLEPNIAKALAVFDLSLIMLSAGLYKIRSGYLQGRGMNFGLRNPMWSYFPDLFSKLPINSFLVRTINFLAVLAELLISFFLSFSLLLNIFQADVIHKLFLYLGCLLLMAMFLILILTVRLGLLSLTMLSIPTWIISNHQSFELRNLSFFEYFIFFIWIFVLLVSYCSLWLEFIDRPVIGIAGIFHELFNFISKPCRVISGAIIWSVFSANHTEIVVNKVSSETLDEISMKNVHINIMLTTLVTYRRYYPQNREEFTERLLIAMNFLSSYLNHGAIQLSFSFLRVKSDDSGREVWTFQPLERWQFNVSTQKCQIEKFQDEALWNSFHDGINGPKRLKKPGSYRTS